jgi:hypothetical protein
MTRADLRMCVLGVEFIGILGYCHHAVRQSRTPAQKRTFASRLRNPRKSR